jgi:hypothetical protein
MTLTRSTNTFGDKHFGKPVPQPRPARNDGCRPEFDEERKAHVND